MPLKVSTLAPATGVAAGEYHSCEPIVLRDQYSRVMTQTDGSFCIAQMAGDGIRAEFRTG